MQMGFYFNQELCINCRTCVVACKDWHDVPAGPVSYSRMILIEKGDFPEVSVHYMFASCYHCEHPACVSACPAGAIRKRGEDGVVVVDRGLCTGCASCLEACPYDAPQFSDVYDTMQKCDFCLERLLIGKNPICVDACIMRALDAGPMTGLREKYGYVRCAEGFVHWEKVMPSIIFHHSEETNGMAVRKIVFSPPMPPERTKRPEQKKEDSRT